MSDTNSDLSHQVDSLRLFTLSRPRRIQMVDSLLQYGATVSRARRVLMIRRQFRLENREALVEEKAWRARGNLVFEPEPVFIDWDKPWPDVPTFPEYRDDQVGVRFTFPDYRREQKCLERRTRRQMSAPWRRQRTISRIMDRRVQWEKENPELCSSSSSIIN